MEKILTDQENEYLLNKDYHEVLFTFLKIIEDNQLSPELVFCIIHSGLRSASLFLKEDYLREHNKKYFDAEKLDSKKMTVNELRHAVWDYFNECKDEHGCVTISNLDREPKAIADNFVNRLYDVVLAERSG